MHVSISEKTQRCILIGIAGLLFFLFITGIGVEADAREGPILLP